MFKQTKLTYSLCALVGATLALSSTLTSAQVQTLEVTGSRIRTVSAESSSPVTVMTAEDIAASGVTNLQDLLLQMPEMGNPPSAEPIQTSALQVRVWQQLISEIWGHHAPWC